MAEFVPRKSKSIKKQPKVVRNEARETAVSPPAALATSLQHVLHSPEEATPQDGATLQRYLGNQTVGKLVIQPKLTVGPAGDAYEQEADSVARQVVSQISASKQPDVQRQEDEEELQMKPMTPVQRQEEEEELQMKPASPLQRQEDEEELQMKPAAVGAEGGELTADLEQTIRSARGDGQPLADTVRAPMEQAFGADFSGVRVHTGDESDALNRAIQARAFTTGQDIFFRSSEYDPGSTGGQELLAHELTHTIQQGKVAQRTAVQRLTIKERMAMLAGQGLQDPEAEKAAITKRIKDNYGVDLDQDAGVKAIQKSYKKAPPAIRNGLKAKDWTLQELQDVETALSRYGALLGANRDQSLGAQPVTTFSRLEKGIDDNSASGVLDDTTAGETFTASKNISMFDAGTTVTDFAKNKAKPTKEEYRKGFRGTIEHELSHALIENLRVGGGKKIIRQFVAAVSFWSGIFTATHGGNSKGQKIANAQLAGTEIPPTKYGATDAYEDLAESLMFYFEEPGTLQTKCPEHYQFIKDVIEPILKPGENNQEEEATDLSALFD